MAVAVVGAFVVSPTLDFFTLIVRASIMVITVGGLTLLALSFLRKRKAPTSTGVAIVCGIMIGLGAVFLGDLGVRLTSS